MTDKSFSWTRCEDFIYDMKVLILANIPDDPRAREGMGGGVDPTSDQVLELIAENELTYGDFVELDERPGRFDSDYRAHQWHRLLRIARNDPDNDLFEILK